MSGNCPGNGSCGTGLFIITCTGPTIIGIIGITMGPTIFGVIGGLVGESERLGLKGAGGAEGTTVGLFVGFCVGLEVICGKANWNDAEQPFAAVEYPAKLRMKAAWNLRRVDQRRKISSETCIF